VNYFYWDLVHNVILSELKMYVCLHVSHWESKQVYKKQHSNNSYKEEIRKISSIIHCHWNIWLTNHFIPFKVFGKSYKYDDNGPYLNFTHIWHTVNKNSLARDQINYETGSHIISSH